MPVDAAIKSLALKSIRRPVKYDIEGTRVVDSQNESVLDIRGWDD